MPVRTPVKEECCRGDELCNEQNQEVIKKKRGGSIKTVSLLHLQFSFIASVSVCVSSKCFVCAAEMCEA